MAVLTLPDQSRLAVFGCIGVQAVAVHAVATHDQRSVWLAFVALFVGGFVTDLISGLAHFGFDYVWPPWMPILGPIAVEFREHHETPTLDPSALLTNFTKAAYGTIPIAVATCIVTWMSGDSTAWFFVDCTLLATSVWMFGFHQIHSYAHMGSRLSPEAFNRAVVEISNMPDKRAQKAEFAKLFDGAGIPPLVRRLQRLGLFLRPEVHWQHHQSFDSDFSSVNGWSDPFTNWLYGPIARRQKVRRLERASVEF
jgi:hypothetical protein